ncbi:TMEM165/GDT1 family protein [Natrinema halophilum]|uniref:TMEM165/GDT1 family protein n=1 Tax=Natrinema halophilum TaxID=1699371 RepID=A0A7D5GGB3_9EURY|nr:TMEM165/GDT1 family protein [Natrinema halophilum]QLG48188.1 TMEM165/GDT1 family protein [Natrinema halophilum]
MAGWLEVFATAFLLQLLALPGEKGQLVIAGLATMYSPYVVVAGAATAFGIWTGLEILLGEALKGSVPVVYLDALTAFLFVFFAVWILYTGNKAKSGDDGRRTDPGDPHSDGGNRGVDRDIDEGGLLGTELNSSSGANGYVSSFVTMGIAEFGDKTQLITISLAARYGADPAIWFGEMLAIVPVSLATAVFFSRTTRYLNLTWVLRASAAMFLLFAADIGSQYLFEVSLLPI